ncbi:unnamed protein product [Caenorhabditis auriculariae]|uniref:Uncharacterized protein n=1 Tax=Caenorhabditis auriculariae TaxID=2777116 RepID=A0A8S1GQZ6_9PELO|nr:unnamed protein product [Caenorhabditis auriculariae]
MIVSFSPLLLFLAFLPLSDAAKPTDKLENLLLPSSDALELVGVQFIDALIKKGQMEMAKGAFKTQLEVLQKVHPEQYEKYKKLKVEDLAADAVLQQAQMASIQPKTGNAFIDMLNGNGIPIGSSLRGIEDAIRTQRDMETQDPSEQIAKAVMEKFQTQILPGLVANMIAGRNPFKMPQQGRRMNVPPAFQQQKMMPPPVQRVESQNIEEEPEIPEEEPKDDPRQLVRRLKASPRLRKLLENAQVASLFTQRRRDAPLRRLATLDEEDESTFKAMEAQAKLDGKSQLLLGIHDFYHGTLGEDDDVEDDQQATGVRRAPYSVSSNFIEKLATNSELKDALKSIKYRLNDVEKYLEPKKIEVNPSPQPGYFVPRKIPTRPRKMIPLLIGMDPNEAEELRRAPSTEWEESAESRVITNLKNNPSIAPLFMDPQLQQKLSGRQMLTPEQKGRTILKRVNALPRLFGSNTYQPIDAKVTQMIEERPVPPLFWTPKGKHTRLRWTGANEREIPGLGSRFILPSLDPTMPALNSAFSTQGRARDEWDTTFKIPNEWNAGDEIGFGMKTSTKRFVGGNGGFDMPAFQL